MPLTPWKTPAVSMIEEAWWTSKSGAMLAASSSPVRFEGLGSRNKEAVDVLLLFRHAARQYRSAQANGLPVGNEANRGRPGG